MQPLNKAEIDFLSQMNASALTQLLDQYPPLERQFYLRQLSACVTGKTTRDSETQKQRDKRAESARIVIPECKNPLRRERALADPELFLMTYFPDRYGIRFGKDHLFMIDTIVSRGKHGGRQAVAAPRGRGKSELVKGLLVFLVCAEVVRFVLPVAATTPLAKRLYRDFKKKLATNNLLLEDFPEICYPIRALEGAPQRATRQHIDGQLTNIVWTGDYVSLPHVPGSPYGGVKMTYYGLDAAFRGANIDGDRPDLIIIDDPETRESAKSLPQIEDREAIIDQDISGLASQEENLAIVVLTTVQNRFSLSYRLTDPKLKPAFNGRRFGMVVQWPKNMDLWNDYIAARHASQAAGDEHGRQAVALYLSNRAAMDDGVEMLSDHFVPVTVDGEELVHSAIQQAFNKIADTNLDAYQTEYQNDPPAEEEIETLGLTAARVQSRLTRYPQRECDPNADLRIVGLDIGKHNSHWTDTAWEGNAIGSVVDYGIMETHGLTADSDQRAIELAILASLEVWADEVVAAISPMLVLIDSGTYTQAVYEFCRRKGRPFYPSKGWAANRFHMPKKQDGKEPFLEAYASKQIEERVWLYNVNTEWWKKWVHQRFLTATHDAAGNRIDGSLALFDPGTDKKRHLSFAHHIVAEEERLVPVYGKELKREWFVKNRNNHWLDALALACAGAGCVGVRLVPEVRAEPKPASPVVTNQPAFVNPHGRPFVARR